MCLLRVETPQVAGPVVVFPRGISTESLALSRCGSTPSAVMMAWTIGSDSASIKLGSLFQQFIGTSYGLCPSTPNAHGIKVLMQAGMKTPYLLHTVFRITRE
jgi:hypothetical protein